MKNKIIIILSLLVLSGCVYSPKQIRYYDKECDVVSKKLVLSKREQNFLLAGSKECADDECIRLALGRIVGIALVGSVSAIISGTIVIAGNTIFWLEKKVNCRKAKDINHHIEAEQPLTLPE